MSSVPTIQIVRGSIKVSQAVWGDGAGGAADLTGYGVEVFEVHPQVGSAVTVAMINAAVGQFSITLDAQALPVGRVGWFRVRLVPLVGDLPLPDALPPVFLDVI